MDTKNITTIIECFTDPDFRNLIIKVCEKKHFSFKETKMPNGISMFTIDGEIQKTDFPVSFWILSLRHTPYFDNEVNNDPTIVKEVMVDHELLKDAIDEKPVPITDESELNGEIDSIEHTLSGLIDS